MSDGQSDRSVVLRGGRTDHMGKGWAEGLHGQSAHALGRTVPKRSVSSTLLGLREKARREPKHRFRSLYREINLPMLYECFEVDPENWTGGLVMNNLNRNGNHTCQRNVEYSPPSTRPKWPWRR